MQAKDVPEQRIVALLESPPPPRPWRRPVPGSHGGYVWLTWDLQAALAEFPPKVVLARLRSMRRRLIIDGCTCGCRGDWMLLPRRAAAA